MTVHFIGKDYSIPADVITYIDLLAFTETAKENLVRAFLNKIKYSIDRIEDNSFLEQEIYNEAQRFIAKLCENGIYNRTVNDYLNSNKGYEFFRTANKDALNRIISFRKARNAAYEAGVQDAIYRKESSVTGLDFGIISGSFVNHMIYASMNASKEKEQEEAALKQYNKEIAELEKSVTSACEASEREYINNIYIPSIKLAFTALAYSWLDSYVRDLIQNGSFDSNALKYTDLERSNDLLKNLSVATNKAAILETAFLACPYNIAVYMNAMKYDCLDYTSFQVAETFKQGDKILSSLRETLGNSSNPQKLRLHFRSADLLSVYTKTPLREITAYMADFIFDNGYAKTIALLSDKTLCRNVLRKASDAEILQGDNLSKEKAAWLVDPIAPSALWDKLTTTYGHGDLLDRIIAILPNVSNVTTKEQLDTYLKEKLYEEFEVVRKELSNQIIDKNRLKAEEEQTKEAELNKKKKRRTIAIIIGIPVAIITIVFLTILSNHIEQKQQEREMQQRIEQYCTFETSITKTYSEYDCIYVLESLAYEYKELGDDIRSEWRAYNDGETGTREKLLSELENKFNELAFQIIEQSSANLKYSSNILIETLKEDGYLIYCVGERHAEGKYNYAFSSYMTFFSKTYIYDCTYYIIEVLYPETFSKGVRDRLLDVGVTAWGNAGRNMLNEMLTYIDSMPEGRTPFESDIATARKQLSEKNAATGK